MNKVDEHVRSFSGNLCDPWTSSARAYSAVFSLVYDSAVGCQRLFLNKPTLDALSMHPSWCPGQEVDERGKGRGPCVCVHVLKLFGPLALQNVE